MLEASVIIVNYRSEDDVCELLASLDATPDDRPRQVIVIDNSPERGLEARVAATVDYRRSAFNCGFAAGVNRGIGLAHCATLILLNPDARPAPGCLRGLTEVLVAEDTVAAGPALLPFRNDERRVPSAIRVDPGWRNALLEHTIVRRFAPADWLDRNYFLSPEATDEPVACAAVQGACMSLRKLWVERVGLFDAERFFLYFEETDLCRRLRAAGGRVVYCPALTCLHRGGGSMPDGRQDKQAYWRSFRAYHRKHGGRAYAALLQTALLAGSAAELGLLCVLDVWRRGRDPILRRDRAALGRQVLSLASAWRR